MTQPSFSCSCAHRLKLVFKCIQNKRSKSVLRQLITTSEKVPFRGAGVSAEAAQQLLRTYLELHGGKPVEDFTHVLPDDGPGDLVVALGRGLHSTACHVIEGNHIGKHPHCFVKGAEPEERKRSHQVPWNN